jgi:hypothetical protein
MVFKIPKNSLEFRTNLLLGFFVTSLALANLLGNKITTLFGIRVSVAIFVFPILFLITDIIEDVHGKWKAKSFVYTGLICQVFIFIILFLSILAPPNQTWGNQAAYESVFSVSLRIIVASIIAFFFSQLHDVWAFNLWKQKTKGRYLWLRNNASTMISQFIDTVIFMFIAFYQVTPKFDIPFIFSLIIPYWLMKVLFAALDTPFVYLGVRWLRGKQQ